MLASEVLLHDNNVKHGAGQFLCILLLCEKLYLSTKGATFESICNFEIICNYESILNLLVIVYTVPRDVK